MYQKAKATSFVQKSKNKINEIANYPALNNTDDVFFVFSEDNIENLKKDPSFGLIGGARRKSSIYNHDGGINPITGQGWKVSDGYSVTITKTDKIDKNGNPVYHYEPKNEVPWTHPVLKAFAAANFNLKTYDSYEDWEESSEAGWLEKNQFKEATGR